MGSFFSVVTCYKHSVTVINSFTRNSVSKRIVFIFRTFMMPNLIPPKIPDGEKVDFDVRKKEKEIKRPLPSTWFVSKIVAVIAAKMQSCERHVAAGYPS